MMFGAKSEYSSKASTSYLRYLGSRFALIKKIKNVVDVKLGVWMENVGSEVVIVHA